MAQTLTFRNLEASLNASSGSSEEVEDLDEPG